MNIFTKIRVWIYNSFIATPRDWSLELLEDLGLKKNQEIPCTQKP